MHYITLDYQTKMGVVYTTLVPSSSVPPLVCGCSYSPITFHMTLWAWPTRSHDRSCGISHTPTLAPLSSHYGIIVPETPYSLSYSI